jgi:hypothetical protein
LRRLLHDERHGGDAIRHGTALQNGRQETVIGARVPLGFGRGRRTAWEEKKRVEYGADVSRK